MELFLECESRMSISFFLRWISSFSVIFSSIFPEKIIFGFLKERYFHICRKKILSSPNIQKTSYLHVFCVKDYLSFSLRRKNIIFSGKRNAIFPDDRRKIIFQCNFFRRTIFSEDLKNISYVHVFFWERSPFTFRLEKNIFSGKRNIIFPDDTRKIIFQYNFFRIIIFKEHLGEKIWFFVQWLLTD